MASFHDNGGIRKHQAHQYLLRIQEKTSVCWVRYAFQVESPATEVTPLRVTAGHHTNGARRAETVIVFQPD